MQAFIAPFMCGYLNVNPPSIKRRGITQRLFNINSVSVPISQAWERAFFETNTPKTRKAAYGQVLFLEQVTALYPGYLIWRVLD